MSLPTPQQIAKNSLKRAGYQKKGVQNWQALVTLRSDTADDGRRHAKQTAFIESQAKRIVIRAGRRGGKTVGVAKKAVLAFMAGKRVLYAAPTEDQVETFWFEVKRALERAIDAGYLYKNETTHVVEVANTKNRIRAKTAWNADTLRGDYADFLILDEFQLMNEDTWSVVGAPMLLDNDGDAVFIYTPPSLHSRSRSKAKDPRYTAKLYAKAQSDTRGRWQAFHFASHENPFISETALSELTLDMTAQAIKQEIEAEDATDVAGALWKQDIIDAYRVTTIPEFTRVVVGVDPPGGSTECGIVVSGLARDGHAYVLLDASLKDTPQKWGAAVVSAYNLHKADRILGEKNYGGDMVENTIRTVPGGAMTSYKNVNATRGKAVRAEPIAAFYERGFVHHVGEFPELESEQTSWIPNAGMSSPNRMDALVWSLTELLIPYEDPIRFVFTEDGYDD